jgi:predicted small secreted protein
MATHFRRILQTFAVLTLVCFVASSCKTTTSAGRQIDDATIKA